MEAQHYTDNGIKEKHRILLMAKVLKSTEFDVSKLDFEPIQGKKKNKTYIQFATYEGGRSPEA